MEIFLIIPQEDDCGAGEAAGVVCDTVGLYRNKNYDNCSLASPVYYPLRLAESHYKRYNNTGHLSVCADKCVF